MAKLTIIEGVGPALSAKLAKGGVRSTEALLAAGATKAGRKSLAERAGIDPKRVLKFVNHADLMRVKGVGGEYAELLEASGVDSVPELSNRNPENLAARMARENAAKKLVRAVPSAKMVARWVAQAKGMGRAVHY